ncbi:MAG: Nramp family divalent metal transporter, partial [Bacteroidetes bacterium]|nr:Nramp family divalent metal transporter [Bacteroidota bacterium]
MNFKNFFRILGPGLIYAGAAVGVSHLVQSTRAGASYGYDLIWILLLANIIKYPFFEFAPRYVSATGNSLISGYQKLGKWAIISYAALTLLTMFAIQAAVTIVTAGLVASAFGLTLNPVIISAIILGITTITLIIGKYSILDKLMKLIIVVLALSTIFAVISAFGQSHPVQSTTTSFDWMNRLDIFFLIAFIGWMPSPIDVSVWSSVWSVAKYKQLGFKPSLKQSLLDFKIGYAGTTILALGFLLLGARILYGNGEELSSNGA